MIIDLLITFLLDKELIQTKMKMSILNHLEEACTAEYGVVAAVRNTGGSVGINEGLVHLPEDPLGHGPVEVALTRVEAVHLGVASIFQLLPNNTCSASYIKDLNNTRRIRVV